MRAARFSVRGPPEDRAGGLVDRAPTRLAEPRLMTGRHDVAASSRDSGTKRLARPLPIWQADPTEEVQLAELTVHVCRAKRGALGRLTRRPSMTRAFEGRQ